MKDRSSLEARWKRRRRGKIGEYKEDCTDGRFSILNPIRFKGDVVVQVWIDSRELATISEWLDKEGSYTRFLSEVVKDSLHMLCREIVESGEVDMVEDTNEARYMLEKKYRVNLNPKGVGDTRRGEKNVLHNIVLSERIEDESGRIPDKIKELQKRAREAYRKVEGEGTKGSIFEELEQIEKGNTHRMRGPDKSPVVNSGRVIEVTEEVKEKTDEMPTLKEGLSQSEFEERMRASDLLAERQEEEMNELLGIGK